VHVLDHGGGAHLKRIGILTGGGDVPGLNAVIKSLNGKSGLMSGMVQGCYAMVPIPAPELGPRKVDVATMYNTERYRPIYANKHGLPIFLNRVS